MRRYHGRLDGRAREHGADWFGVKRRLEALHAIGWTGQQLADELGITLQAVHRLRTVKRPIYPSTAEKIRGLYERLSSQPQAGYQADRMRRLALKHGWAPPLAWDDIDDLDEKPKHRLTRKQLNQSGVRQLDGRLDRAA
jgi:transcriptional regulator with XRE-family HTH domain